MVGNAVLGDCVGGLGVNGDVGILILAGGN